jgi:hypothetical protein
LLFYLSFKQKYTSHTKDYDASSIDKTVDIIQKIMNSVLNVRQTLQMNENPIGMKIINKLEINNEENPDWICFEKFMLNSSMKKPLTLAE